MSDSSGAMTELLRRSGPRLSGDRLVLQLPAGGTVMFGAAVQRRLEALGGALEREAGTIEA